jgi:hypothetical protein
MLQQPPRCRFDEIQHFLEPVGPTVVWIGHLCGIRLRCEFEEQANTIAGCGWGALLERVEVLPIHCEYQVVAAEILWLDYPCTKCGHVVAAAERCLTRACVWRSADVVRGGTRGSDFEGEIGRFTRRNLAKHHLRGGRAADVPQADE